MKIIKKEIINLDLNQINMEKEDILILNLDRKVLNKLIAQNLKNRIKRLGN